MAKTRVRLGTARFWRGAKSQDIVDLLLPDLAPYYDEAEWAIGVAGAAGADHRIGAAGEVG